MSQATSSQRSGVSAKLSSVSQSMVWMVTPLPVVTMPTMRSPGSGWQQPAKCTAMPGIRPLIGTALARLLACWRGAAERHDLVGRRPRACAPGKTAFSTSRAGAVPSPTAAIEIVDAVRA